MSRRWIARLSPPCLTTAFLAVVVAGCGGGGGAASSDSGSGAKSAGGNEKQEFSGPGGTFTARLNADWTDFDFQTLSLRGKNMTTVFAYDRLLAVDAKGKVIPYLATSWDVKPDEITFKLRTDAKCADGTPVTPDVILKSFQRLVKDGGSNAVFFGAGPFEVSADDAAKTFTFRTKTPNSDMIYSFAAPYTQIICPAGLANPDQLKTKMFGSGPYTLESARHADRVTLKLRPDWNWGPNGVTSKTPGLPQTVVVRIATDDTTAANLMLTGEFDAGEIAGPDTERLAADSRLAVKTFDNYTLQPLAFNMREGHVTTDANVRKGLSLGVDQQGWSKSALNGEGITSTSFITKSADCFDPTTSQVFPKYDMNAAKAAFAEAGYTDQGGKLMKDGKQLRISLLTSVTQNSGPDYVASQYKKLGIDVKLSKLEYSAYSEKIFKGDFDVSPEAWPGYTPSPAVSLAYGYGPTPENKGSNLSAAGEGDKDYTDTINAALGATGDQRCAEWGKVQHMILERNYWLPLAAPKSNFFYQKNGVDFIPYPQWWEPYSMRKAA